MKSLYFKIHPVNPQHRLILQAAEVVRDGGVIVYPTDSTYALGCHMEDKAALDRIVQIRRLDEKHHFTLICRDLSEVSIYARFDTPVYRLLKSCTPGPYTFILKATREVPRRLMHPKQKTVGLRVPEHAVTHALLEALGEPMMTTTLLLPHEEYPMNDAELILDALSSQVDLVIDGGACGTVPTTLVDMTGDIPLLLRKGKRGWVNP
ncbi:threonylcarbamoyl-AMP synthase [bacterium]|nr:threonylcarbamoyl-AMP synthase [bacterium]